MSDWKLVGSEGSVTGKGESGLPPPQCSHDPRPFVPS